jgi:hypothetical protein
MMAEASGTEDDRLAGFSPAARDFFAYWDGLSKHDFVPRRDDFDPVAVKQLLPDIAILQYRFADPPAVVFRLAGTSHVARWGRELTGLNYLDFVPLARRPLAWARQRLIVEHPCGTHSYRIETFESGRQVRLESVALPLRSRDGRADLMIVFSREAPDQKVERWRLGTHQAFADSVGSRFIDIGKGVPADPAK